MPKFPTQLTSKGKIWAIDELQIVCKNTGMARATYHKILAATDLFSHFVIGHLTEEQVIEFIQLRIIAVFGTPKIIVTDNASIIDSTLVRGACTFLNIYICTISPYASKSKLQKLINRLILDTMRNLTNNYYIKPQNFHFLLAPVLKGDSRLK